MASGYLSQAKDFIVNTFETIKEAISEDSPQASVNHKFTFLNDIANSRWNKLNHVETVEKTNLKAMGWNDFKLSKRDRTSLWKSINANDWKLKHVETKDTSGPFIDRSFKLRSLGGQRKALLNDIASFNTRKLRHVLCPLSFRQYMSNIAGSRWRPLKHVETTERKPNWNDFKLRRRDRTSLLNSIRSGTQLKHIEVRSNPLYIEPGFRLRMLVEQRRNLLKDIISFDKQRLRKPFLEDIANCKWTKLRTVQTKDKSQISTLGWNSFNSRRRVLDEVVEFSKNPQFSSTTLQKEAPVNITDQPYSKKAEAMQ